MRICASPGATVKRSGLRTRPLGWPGTPTLTIVRRMVNNATVAPGVAAEEADSYCVLAGRADAGLIVLCDHAGNTLPPQYGRLGLPPEQLGRHIAYDIGAAPITAELAAALGVPAVMTRYSRLLIDPNRGADDPTLIMRLSDGAVVPGNRRLDASERAKRLDLYYRPYHAAITRVIDQCLASGVVPALLSIHSFTESWKTTPRPWHVGILWDQDARLAKPLLDSFYGEGDLIVGDNEPYSGQLEGDCLWQHGTRRGLANAIIEIRQDLIRDAFGQAAWARRLQRIVAKILRDSLAKPAFNSAETTEVALGNPSDLSAGILARRSGDDQDRQKPRDRAGSSGIPPPGPASTGAQRGAEHRPDEHGGLLPQLPSQLVPGGGQRQGA
jgi:predicted N-formylglutamate amidohydrolase